MIEIIPNPGGITEVEFHPQYSVICSVGKAPFAGTMDITYRPNAWLLEFESFEDWLLSIAMAEYTIESLCQEVGLILLNTLHPSYLRVKINATTIKHGPASAMVEITN